MNSEQLALSENQLDHLRHMLGINDPSVADPVPGEYRNYAAVNPGDPEYVELERLGMVERYRLADRVYSYDYYRATVVGTAAALASAMKRRLPKSKRRYLRWLSISDTAYDLTFREFLTSPRYAEARASA